jgi:3-oxoacyl-[acyl-carrier protein] reductase
LIARNKEALTKVIGDLDTSLAQQHGFLIADFSKPDEVRTKIEEHVKNHAVHILINNTGGPPAGMIIDAKEEDFLKRSTSILSAITFLQKRSFLP